MKHLILLIASLSALNANARQRMVDGIPDENVVQAVEITGRPGFKTQAALVRNGGTDDLSFVIIETRGAENFLVVDNAKMNLTELTNAKLSVTESGSVRIASNNDKFPTRDRWSRAFVVSFRQGRYLATGFTLDYLDSLTGQKDACDYNLLTSKGVRNGRPVRLRTPTQDIGVVEDAEKLYTCKGW